MALSLRPYLVGLVIFAAAFTAFAQNSHPTDNKESPASVLLQRLQREVLAGDLSRVSTFWDEVKGKVPLIEPIPGDDQNVLVTYLWRGGDQTRSVFLAGGVPDNGAKEKPLRRLLSTDVWYRSERTPLNARFSYRFRLDAPPGQPVNYQEIVNREVNFPVRADPLNPNSHPLDGSMVILSKATKLVWSTPVPGTPSGEVTEQSHKSAILNQSRPLWVYTPAGYRRDGKPHHLLIVLDGRVALRALNLPTVLDNMIARGEIPPLVAVCVGNTDPLTRSRDYMGSEEFAKFLAIELVPWLRKTYNITSDRLRVTIAGFSLGGFAATYAGFTHPETFGNVMSLSGAHWYYPGWFTQNISFDTETGWLTKQFAASPRRMQRFYISVGKFEASYLHNYLEENRRLRDVLTAKGYPLRYNEYMGGHDIINWAAVVPEGLVFLLNSGGKP